MSKGALKFENLAWINKVLFQNITHHHFTTSIGTKVGNLNNSRDRTANINLKQVKQTKTKTKQRGERKAGRGSR